MASANFSSLPAERRLQILSNLPVQDILNTRLVSKDCKELVDTPENQKSLLDPVERRELARIQSFVDYNLGYDKSKLGFLGALKRFLALRGIRSDYRDENTGWYHLLAFAHLWAYGSEQPHPPYTDPNNPAYIWYQAHPRASQAAGCASDLVRLQIRYNMPSSRNLCGYNDSYNNRAGRNGGHFVTARGHQAGFAFEELCKMFRLVRQSHCPAFQGKVLKGDNYVAAMSDFPLTRLVHPQQLTDSQSPAVRAKIERQTGLCSISKVRELFPGVVALPEGYYWAYCVKSRWAYELVKNMVDRGKPLSRSLYLAVLEELYVY